MQNQLQMDAELPALLQRRQSAFLLSCLTNCILSTRCITSISLNNNEQPLPSENKCPEHNMYHTILPKNNEQPEPSENNCLGGPEFVGCSKSHCSTIMSSLKPTRVSADLENTMSVTPFCSMCGVSADAARSHFQILPSSGQWNDKGSYLHVHNHQGLPFHCRSTPQISTGTCQAAILWQCGFRLFHVPSWLFLRSISSANSCLFMHNALWQSCRARSNGKSISWLLAYNRSL